MHFNIATFHTENNKTINYQNHTSKWIKTIKLETVLSSVWPIVMRDGGTKSWVRQSGKSLVVLKQQLC